MNQSEPFVSIVIPTCNRPALLRRAVASCQAAIAPGPVEVIVVANGGEAPEAIDGEPGVSVRVLHVPDANANLARNTGLSAARGRFVRFLDDDDYLLAPGARAQHELAGRTMPDICSGGVQIIDGSGSLLDRIRHHGGDLVAAVLSPGYASQGTAHVYRRDFLAGMSWDPARRHLQDVAWLHDLVRRSEVRWETLDDVVGVWCHHAGARTSTGALREFPERALRELHAIVAASVDWLAAEARLTDARRRAAAESLWHCVHHGFPAAPLHWTGVGRQALVLDPCSRPAAFAGTGPWVRFNPIVLEWCLFPHRKVKQWVRTA